ncbi:rRNA maturation RNase YbeY [Yunchengibacter salinarum]|uniref:rRNA maturation RNase YbeY n=1 Tax=Yunchengibacter salinarum TaxID=3133399 RepID=UPI0035B61CBE
MSLDISAVDGWRQVLPDAAALAHLAAGRALYAGLGQAGVLAAVAATGARPADSVLELGVRFDDDDAVRGLNATYRGKDRPTNVLSFPGLAPDALAEAIAWSATGGPPVLLGDLVLARGVVQAEAASQAKTVSDHALHLLVHGCLHLVGFDHMADAEAERMETLERDIMAALGRGDPYGPARLAVQAEETAHG